MAVLIGTKEHGKKKVLDVCALSYRTQEGRCYLKEVFFFELNAKQTAENTQNVNQKVSDVSRISIRNLESKKYFVLHGDILIPFICINSHRCLSMVKH